MHTISGARAKLNPAPLPAPFAESLSPRNITALSVPVVGQNHVARATSRGREPKGRALARPAPIAAAWPRGSCGVAVDAGVAELVTIEPREAPAQGDVLARAPIGAAGPLGAVAGMLPGGRKKQVGFTAELDDGRKFMAVTGSKTRRKIAAAAGVRHPLTGTAVPMARRWGSAVGRKAGAIR